MFGALTEKFKGILSYFGGKKELTIENVAEAAEQVRSALLEADVNYVVVDEFVRSVQEKGVGDAILKSLTAGEQFITLIHDELVALMGPEEPSLELKGSPTVILLCGLQGSGKTTQCAKLGAYLQKKGSKQKILMAACDLQRPAAVQQLEILCTPLKFPVFKIEGEKNPVKVAKKALQKAKEEQFDLLIIDTAGRLHLDLELMGELEEIKKEVNPHEVLLVISSAMGQDAVTTAAEFDKKVGMTGTILTMLDGSGRAGAALSIRKVTQKPLKFEGIGEKVGDFQLFNAKSMASRMLGMGDTLNLVRRAQEEMGEKEAQKLEKKIRKALFTYEDYLSQLNMIKKMGPLKGLLQMLPGVGALPQLDQSEKEFRKITAIISSMTKEEREEKRELVPSCRWRLAKGSGTSIEDVDRFLKRFKQTKRFLKDKKNMERLEGLL